MRRARTRMFRKPMQKAVIVGAAGKTGRTMDGVNWVANTALAGAVQLEAVVRNASNTMFLATTTASPYVYRSYDGVTWEAATLIGSWGGGMSPYRAWWSDGLNSFIIQATYLGESFYLIVPPDGSSWNDENIGIAVAVTDYVNATSIGVHMFTTSTGGILSSITGLDSSWSYARSASGTSLNGIAWSPTIPMFVAVGNTNNLLSSPTGTTWTSRTSSLPTVNINDVAWSPALGIFVAVADSGYNCYSTNGTTWTSGSRPTTSNLTKVAWNAELAMFIAAGANGEVWTSTSAGGTWTQRTVGFGSSAVIGVG